VKIWDHLVTYPKWYGIPKTKTKAKKKAQNEYQGESHLHATAFVLF